MKHTPGPWKAIEHKSVNLNDYIQILAGSWDIAHNKFSARNWEEEQANARLIAAAPDLLEACQAALNDLYRQMDSQMTEETEQKVKNAIAKATGDSQ